MDPFFEKRNNLYKRENNKTRLNLRKQNHRHNSNRHINKYADQVPELEQDLEQERQIVIDISDLDRID